uniref:Mab-21-like HhH/H2TH-like domain-containing protein n=1 Tax=Apteryx owenii TaxID=8824 RepID=A0A8B9NZJ1_APTOW
MQQHEQQLSHEMTRLQHKVERIMEEPQSGLSRIDVLFATWEMRLFGAFAGALVLLFGLFRMATEQHFDDSSSDDSTSSSEEEEEDPAEGWGEERFLQQLDPWMVQCLAKRSNVVQTLVGDLLRACRLLTSKTLLPQLQPCIGMGSAFEGWSPGRHTTVYSLLVPLKPPTGHSFQPRDGRVRVQLECMCQRKWLLGDALCFLHHSDAELRRHEGPSFLHYLCTHSYLNVEKTTGWLQLVLMNAWLLLPPLHHCTLKLLPSSRSCKLRLANASGRPLFIDILLGMQQGDSAVYFTSQEAEAGLTSSTTWLESCAVPEMLFFSFVASQAPSDSCHLQCLQLFARLMRGTSFSSYCLKTVVMHLLTALPLSSWHRADVLEHLNNVLHYLHRCLERKQLHHFLLGNDRVPTELLLHWPSEWPARSTSSSAWHRSRTSTLRRCTTSRSFLLTDHSQLVLPHIQ